VSGGAYSLGAGQSQTVTARFSPTSTAGASANITCTGGGGAVVALSGNGDPLPAIEVTPTSIPFGTVPVGSSADVAFTVRNTGGGVLSGAAATSAPFSIVTATASYNLAGGQSRSFTVRFTPSAGGTASANITCTGGGGATVALAGLGDPLPSISVTPTALAFGLVTVSTTADRTFSVKNNGGQTLTGTATTSAPFSIVSGGSYALAAGQSQTVTARFAPTSTTGSGSSVTCTGAGGASVALSGVGDPLPVIAVVPHSISFGTVPVGSSADIAIAVTNTGGGVLVGAATTSAPFSITGAATFNLSAGQSASIVVRFTPSVGGTSSATVALTGGGGAIANVSGTGDPVPSISTTPTALAFGLVPVSTTADLTFAVKNEGGQMLSGTATTSAPFSIVSGGIYSLATGQSQMVTARFAPTATGVAVGSVQCTGGGGVSLVLSGAGGLTSGNSPPAALLEPLPATVGGDVVIRYRLFDLESDTVTAAIEYSTNGTTFTSAIERIAPPSEGTTGLASSPIGTSHFFVWDTLSELGLGEHRFVLFRIRPFDVTAGAVALSAAFRVDNVRPTVERVRYIDDNATRRVDHGDTLLVTFTEPMQLGSLSSGDFETPVAGDSLGMGAIVSRTAEPRTVQVRLGTNAVLTTSGMFAPTETASGSPSGLDVTVGIAASGICDLAGNPPSALGVPGLGGDGVDIEDFHPLRLGAQRPILLARNDLVELHAALGDLDGDGVDDLALGSPGLNPISGLGQWTNAVTTVRGLSTGGSFDGRFGKVTENTSGLGPGPVVLADFDGDGHLDAAFAEQKSPSVLVMTGAGDLSLTSSRRLSVAMTPTAIAAADLNGDGISDLVVGGTGNQIAVLVGRGASGLGSGDFDPSSFVACPGLVANLVLVDIDNDRILDIVVAAGPRVSILRGQGANGRGTATFAAPASIALGGTVAGVAVGDIDQDSWIDIAAATGNSIALLRNWSGSFAGISASLDAGSVVGPLALYDLNGDSFLDLVAAIGTSMKEFCGRSATSLGPNSFDPARTIAVGGLPAPIIQILKAPSTDPRRAELVIVRRGVSSSVSSLVLIPTDRGGHAVSQPTIQAPGAGFAGRIGVADFNGDHVLDAALSTASTESLRLLTGQGTNGIGNGAFASSSLGVGSFPLDLAVSDLNSDGFQDIVSPEFSSSEILVLLGAGVGGVPDGTFQLSSAILSVSSQPSCIAVGLVDTGSNPDIVVAHQTGTFTVLLGAGDGTFSSASTPTGGGFARFLLEDLDLDGKVDILSPRDGLRSLRGNGDGTFESMVQHGTIGGFGVAVGDFDRNGKPDAAVGSQIQGGRVVISLNNSTIGAVSFSVQMLLALYDPTVSEQFRPDGIAVADFDGDGLPDVSASIGRSAGENLVGILLKRPDVGPAGELFYEPAHLFITAGSDSNGAPLSVLDFDKDGRQDLLVATTGGIVSIGNNSPTGNGPSIAVTPTALVFGSVTTTADMTFIVTNAGGGTLVGTATASGAFSIVGPASYSLTTGQSHTITVRYTASSSSTVTGSVTLTGGGGVTVSLSAGARWGEFDWGAGRWTEK